MHSHYPPVAGYPLPKKRGKDKSAPLLAWAPRDPEPFLDQRPSAKPPLTLCGRTSLGKHDWTRTDPAPSCKRCRKILEKYPQLGNQFEQSTLAEALG